MEEVVRSLTPAERRALERLKQPSTRSNALFGAFFAFMVTLGLALIVTPTSWLGPASLIPVVPAIIAAVLVFRRLQRSGQRYAWLRQVDRDLSGGVASVTTFRVKDAIAVEEFEDEGSQYYLHLDDRGVLFLAGQYLYEAEEEGRFPNTVIVVTRAPATRIVFDLQCLGSPLPVSSRRQSFTEAEYTNGLVPEDGALLDVTFDSLRTHRTATL